VADTIDIALEVTGATQTQQALDRTAKAVDSVTMASGKAAPALKGAGSAIDQTSQNSAKLSTFMGSLSPIIGRVSGEAAKMTQVFSTAGSTITGLSSVVGGPLGLALGGAVAATGLLVTAMSEAEEAAAKEREEVEKTTKSLDDYIAAASKARAADELRRRLQTGTGSADEQAGLISQRQAELNETLQRRAQIEEHLARLEASSSPALASRIRFAREQLQATNDNISAAQRSLESAQRGLVFAKQRDAEEEYLHSNENKRADTKHANTNRAIEDQRRLQAELDKWLESTAGRADFSLGEEGDPSLSLQRATNAGNFNSLFARPQQDVMSAASVNLGNTVSESSKNMADSGVESAKVYSDAWQNAFGMVSQSAAQAFSDMAAGKDVHLESNLQGIGTQAIAKGTLDVFEGTSRLIASWGTDQSGTALIATGGAEIAFGAGLAGAAGAAGGGGASGRGGPTGVIGGPPKPGDQMQGGSQQGGDHVTIVLNNLVPDAYAGERVNDALRRDQYRRGRAAR